MLLAVAGKGGSGKTTIAGTLCRVMAREGRRVRAIDGDSNPNLAIALGVPPSEGVVLPGLPSDLLISRVDTEGNRELVLAKPPTEIFEAHGMDAPDGIRLLVASRIDHAGSG